MFPFFSPLINKKPPTARLLGASDVALQEHWKRPSPLAPAIRLDRDRPWLSCPISLSKHRHARPALPAALTPVAMPNLLQAPTQLHCWVLPAARLPAPLRTRALPLHPICLPGSSGHSPTVALGVDIAGAKATVRTLGKTPADVFWILLASASSRDGLPMEIKPSGSSQQKAFLLHGERDLGPCLKEPLCTVIKCSSNR